MSQSTDPVSVVQGFIDTYCTDAATKHNAPHTVVVAGAVTPSGSGVSGQLLFGGSSPVNPEGDPITLDSRTPLEIGSVSKIFTSGMAGNVNNDYGGMLTQFVGPLAETSSVAGISIQDLASYRSGLAQDNDSRVYPPGTMASLESLFSYLSTPNQPFPPYPPGSCYAYSNLGWALLGMAALGLQSTDTPTFVDEYGSALSTFCAPLEMTDTKVFGPDLVPTLPMAYGQTWQPLADSAAYQPLWPALTPAGGIVSTGADMMRFLLYNMGQPLPGVADDRPFAYQQGTTSNPSACGGTTPAPITSYGWFHAQFVAPGEPWVLGKDGGVDGFTSYIGFERWWEPSNPSPSTTGCFVLTNSHGAQALGHAALTVLLGGTATPPEDPVAASVGNTHYVGHEDD